MGKSQFYGITLTAENNTIEWNLTGDKKVGLHRLIIKQVLLGAEAQEGEYNVVEANIVNDRATVPIAVLKAGETRFLNPTLEFYETKVTFKLIKGNGPVHICGQNIKENVEWVWLRDLKLCNCVGKS